jgi:hypothetical protein
MTTSVESDHGAEVLEWRPGYQHEVVVVARLRHVCCPSGCEETPAVVLRIDNADHAGEIAMTAEDLSSMVSGLIDLGALLPPPRDAPGAQAPPPRVGR